MERLASGGSALNAWRWRFGSICGFSGSERSPNDESVDEFFHAKMERGKRFGVGRDDFGFASFPAERLDGPEPVFGILVKFDVFVGMSALDLRFAAFPLLRVHQWKWPLKFGSFR